eukprot:TRINITY_DN6114_c0_g6_i1.p1 TRINITY_DN6114_c0_g6~~TRINITY_DN6114_c0_g6_i1.p1  ORF type:complete len:128 (-),score=17.89 TRINITY_DN6114_c0_g6_i1:274-657(-)
MYKYTSIKKRSILILGKFTGIFQLQEPSYLQFKLKDPILESFAQQIFEVIPNKMFFFSLNRRGLSKKIGSKFSFFSSSICKMLFISTIKYGNNIQYLFFFFFFFHFTFFGRLQRQIMGSNLVLSLGS